MVSMEKGDLAGTQRCEAGAPQASIMDGDPTWHSEGERRAHVRV